MILQSVVFSNDIQIPEAVFYHTCDQVMCKDNNLILTGEAKVTTDTYMNLFDYEIWRKYTGLERYAVRITYEGTGMVSVYEWSLRGKVKIKDYILESEQNHTERFEIHPKENECAIYLEIVTQNQLNIMQIAYETWDDKIYKHPVHITLLSCTYQRKKEVLSNIQKVKKTRFYQLEDELYGKLDFCVVDNGSELEEKDEDYFKLVQNPNTGGSGGFTRGILEARKEAERYGTTHVIFMDDDVLFIEETFYRLYTLLSLIKEEYKNEVVAGRMFRLDARHIQYTASEIWNKSHILHVGHNVDMSKSENLLNVNDRRGEYTGWWFGCFPMSFVRKNLPLPFFLHCDDVEYGLRHGGEPIVLNGIQVWHETAEYRVTPTIVYYDVRNSMIVNTIYGFCKTPEELLELWYLQLGYYHRKKDYRCKYAVIVALWDYMKGKKHFMQNPGRKKLWRFPVCVEKCLTAVLWRVMKNYFVMLGVKTCDDYRK